MSQQTEYRYRAFISYSHKDKRWAKWLHRELERYVVPRELVGRTTKRGTIARKLGTFCLDREDLAVGDSLSGAIVAALQASEALIVLCSLASSKSKYVAEEIKFFKESRRGDRILPLIVDSSPEFELASFFPAALLPSAAAAGASALNIEPVPLAADIRPDKDGEELAKLKLIAGLVGVPLHELRQREAAAEKRRRQVRTAVAATATSLAIAAGISAKVAIDNSHLAQANQTKAEANFALAQNRLQNSFEISFDFAREVIAESDRLGISSEKAMSFLKLVENAVGKLANEDPDAKVLTERRADISLAFCDIYMKLGRLLEWEQSAKKAEEQFRLLLDAVPGDAALKVRLGKATYQVALALQEQGYLEASQGYFLTARDIRSELVKSAPKDSPQYPTLARDLSAVYLMLGQGSRSQGDFAQALDYFNKTLRLREELAQREPNTATRQQDVAMALTDIGETYFLLTDLRNAEAALERGRDIRRKLFEGDKDSTFFKRHYAWSLAHLAKLRLAQGYLRDAYSDITEAHRLMEQVSASDTQNVIFQSDLAWFVGYRGEIISASKSTLDAVADFEKASSMLQALLAKHDGTHMGRMRGVAYWTYHHAEALREAGKYEEALALYDNAVKLLMTITTTDRTNAIWRAELASNYLAQAGALERLGRRTEKLDALARAQRMLPPVISPWPIDFAWRAVKEQLEAMEVPPAVAPTAPAWKRPDGDLRKPVGASPADAVSGPSR